MPLLAVALGCSTLVLISLAGAELPQQWRVLASLAALGAAAWGVASALRRWTAQRHLRHAQFQRDVANVLALTSQTCYELDANGTVLRRYADGHEEQARVQAEAGKLFWELPGLTMASADLARLQKGMRHTEVRVDLPVQRLMADGSTRYFLLSTAPRSQGEHPEPGHWALLRDVTEERKARNALIRTESRFRDLFRRIPTPLVVHRDGIVVDANPVAVSQFGFTDLASMVGQDILQVYEEGESRERARKRLRELDGLAPGQALTPAEYRLVPGPGRLMTMQSLSVTVDSIDGQGETLVIYIDNTERRQAEDALQRSEALLSHLVANSPDVITLTELGTGRYAMVNPTFSRVTGYAIHEVIGKTSAELRIWANLAERAAITAALARSETVQNIPATFTVRDGRRVQMLVSAARFSMDGRDYVIINARDVTAVEQARLEREAILENVPVGIALTRDQHFLMANPRLEQMLGWPAGQLMGRHISEVWPSTADYDAAFETYRPPLVRGEPIEFERTLQRRDGRRFLCRLQAKAVDTHDPGHGSAIWMAEDVTDRRNAEQALAKARDDAEAASLAKSAFLANTSHEIRTPLNALLGLARMARQPTLDESRRRQYIEQISESAETLSGILTDILDLSKIEAGKMHLDDVIFSLRDLLSSLRQAYGALADTKGLTLTIEFDEDLPDLVQGDPVRVRQILSNFLNNALKFTDDGQVRLAARVMRPGLIRFEVIDTGPGIDEAIQQRLFSPFMQADSSVTRSFGGTGLGLSICRELAELMHGHVGVVSLSGHGSCFFAELPLPTAEFADMNAVVTSGGMDAISGAHVLMVEDNAVNMMIGVAMLEQWGAVVAQAADGHEAIAAVLAAHAKGHPFDVVLMDVQMPGMSGHEATRQLRQRFGPQELPIIALTAAALVSERNEALTAGMNDFLTKPIDSQRLRVTLAKILQTGEDND
ncbi:MAG: PAS domain S-box protein [Vitreoscilla sp.]|nr:PAS domain S-box protein [Vitreoscilla sp.]MBP6675676.1 PAS domain S-box protein [Vitreoscilla sp.]